MTRRCSHCSHNGHNSRTCPNRGVKLFGVRLTDGSIRKSASMGNLSLLAASAEGYASDDYVQGSSSSCRERKKGVPWTEEEHRMFLIGLQKLGKGDWRGISRNYVVSRTPTQVASHAQKYFIRQTNMTRRKRRSSLFDMVPDEPIDFQPVQASQEPETQENDQQLLPPAIDEQCESMDSSPSMVGEAAVPSLENPQCSYPVIVPAYFPPFIPFSLPLWPPGYKTDTLERETHEIVKPTPVLSKAPINVDELVGMSRLSIGESKRESAESSTSLNLLDNSNRRSAFHANPQTRAQA
ncbi:transcription factor MYB1R1 [Ananas comosus]|uniref:Transcription factor MYB1R1 n=1 Tax=Ananas comosus TaxID=4615 RepID=A0A6P5FD27_ANACO|nr:transcription factor MYB1R1 [Ananas comosus]